MSELDELRTEFLPWSYEVSLGAVRALESALAERDAALAVIEQVHAARRENAYDGEFFYSTHHVDKALATSPPDALDAVKAAAWDEGVAAALNYAIRNDDGITLRLEHLDGRPWQNPYRKESPNE